MILPAAFGGVIGGGGVNFKSAVIVTTPQQLSGSLSSTTLYMIDGVVDFTGTGLSIEVPSGGLNLSGWTFDISKLTCSDSDYTMFTSEAGGSGNLLGQDFAIEVTGLNSKVYDLVDVDGTP